MVNDYQDRAKQFMPFDALKGLQDELRKKEGDVEEEEIRKCNFFIDKVT